MPKILNYIKCVFFVLILMIFHFGFGNLILTTNGIKEIGWFRILRFLSLSLKLTFLSVIVGTIIICFDV